MQLDHYSQAQTHAIIHAHANLHTRTHKNTHLLLCGSSIALSFTHTSASSMLSAPGPNASVSSCVFVCMHVLVCVCVCSIVCLIVFASHVRACMFLQIRETPEVLQQTPAAFCLTQV